MNLPNIKDARKRSKDKVNVYYDKYNIPETVEKKLKEGRNNLKMFSHWCRKEHEKVGEKTEYTAPIKISNDTELKAM